VAALLVYGIMLLERTLAVCCELSDKRADSSVAID
jgi:hypothetical protein